ncbi:Rv3235 family protein [Streptomyces sp. SP18CS02]|uniref:Rv3235 family protein n=1 Tax=Streptomyces sp. SP18CS02 TaxID=3002531 RepID=UPI002E7A4A66|nr:Rv3235 family protein [Streptomyces sp. SP18CS02]MEE1752195.1 Rv3235 family protein [Streptomyces sp. SP18CS02]
MGTSNARTASGRVTATRGTAGPGGRRDQRGPGGPGGSRGTGGPGGPGALRRPRPLLPHVLFAERLLAVLSGERPVHWMLGQTVGAAYEQLIRLAPGAPLRGHGTRPVVRRCGGFPPRPGVVEAFASIAAGERVRAMAFRLEQGADRKWRCAAVELDSEHSTATATSSA